MNTVLETEAVSISFGGVRAADQVSFRVQQGELLGFIGPNGAGKTTLIRLVTGILRPDSGLVYLNGRNVTGLPTHRRVRLGLALTHQLVRPFRGMSALENVVLAAGLARTANPVESLFQIGRAGEVRRAEAVLEKVGLAENRHVAAENLPLGMLKRLEVARALVMEPTVVLMDEPLAGLNQQEASTMADTIVELNGQGLTVVLVEHNLGEVLRVSKRLLVMDNGRLIAEGEPGMVMGDPQVQEAYLGKSGECHVSA